MYSQVIFKPSYGANKHYISVISTFKRPGEGGGGVLGISSDEDDRRIFLGLKFSIPGIFWVRKFGLGSLI